MPLVKKKKRKKPTYTERKEKIVPSYKYFIANINKYSITVKILLKGQQVRYLDLPHLLTNPWLTQVLLWL